MKKVQTTRLTKGSFAYHLRPVATMLPDCVLLFVIMGSVMALLTGYPKI